jgi:2'-5' RNA ligase
MRLFAALPLSGGAQRELADLIRAYERTDWPVRWVRDAGLHLTVKFFGETGPARVPEIEAALQGACRGAAAIPLMARDLGAFPNLEAPRVLWAGYDADPALELLAHRLEQGCAALGFPLEGRPFRPHVTIGRLREGRSLARSAVEQLEQRTIAEGFIADRLILYHSVTGPTRAEYQPLATIPLGA